MAYFAGKSLYSNQSVTKRYQNVCYQLISKATNLVIVEGPPSLLLPWPPEKGGNLKTSNSTLMSNMFVSSIRIRFSCKRWALHLQNQSYDYFYLSRRWEMSISKNFKILTTRSIFDILAEMEDCASAARMLAEEIWQIAEGFVEVPTNL